jgi:RimJ/RimL family protein N-acetyltransferase
LPRLEPVELRGESIVLRPPAAADEAAIVDACQDEEITRFIPLIPDPYTAGDARTFLRRVREQWLTEDPERTLTILDTDSGEFLGVVTVRLRQGGTVGYWLKPAARGKGVTTEAVRAVLRWAQEQGITHLFLTTHPSNVASQRVAEKTGFRLVSTTTAHPRFKDGTTTAFLFELGMGPETWRGTA